MLARSRELDQIAGAIRRADTVGAVLTGEAGVGKSTLLQRAAERGEEEGFVVVRLFGSRATATLPLCAFSSFLADAPPDESAERFAVVRRALSDLAAGRPILFAIDDVHLLDDASAVLVSQLARERIGFAVCTIRDGEPAPEPIAALWLQGSMTIVELAPFDVADAATLAAETLGGTLHPALERELWARTGGNPLFLRELVTGSKATGAIEQIDGVWTQVGPLEPSAALGDLVARHLDALSPEQQHALSCVALSEPVSATLIEQVADDEALIALEEAGLIQVVQDRRRTTVRLTHPMYGEVIRARTSQLRARKQRRALADAVEAFGARRRDDPLTVASWRLESGDVDVARFTAAARDAIRRYDAELAERLALAAHEHTPDASTARALATARLVLGRPGEALAALDAAAAGAEPGGAEWVRLGFLEGLVRIQGLGDYDGGLDVLRRVTASETSEATRNRVDAMIATAELLRGHALEAIAISERLITAGVADLVTIAAHTKAMAANGRPAAALEVWHQHTAALPAALIGPDAVDALWFTLIDEGDLDEAERRANEAWDRASDAGDRSFQVLSSFALGHQALHRGQLTTAIRWFDTAGGLSLASNVPWAHAGRALASAQLGDLDAARSALEAMDSYDHSAALYFDISARRARGWVLALGGEPTRGREHLVELADLLTARGFLTQAVRTLTDLARVGDPTGALARLTPIADAIDGRGLRAQIAFVAALAGGDADALMQVSDELAGIGMAALAAEAASAARDALAKHGRARDASGCARRATELIRRTEGGVTPMFAVVESVVPLTRREREIAALVAAGRTSREVAEACFLSVRTVETHLARIYDKLGINSRAELSDALGPLMIGSAA